MKKGVLHIIVYCVSSTWLGAQQLDLSNQYRVNPYELNSAFAGSKNATQVLLGTRRQWIGFDGAPEFKYVSINSNVYRGMGVGAIAHIRETGLFRKFDFKLSYSYLVKLSVKHELAFGLSGVYSQKTFNFSAINVDDITDSRLLNQNFNKAQNANVDFGIRYRFQALNVGVSVQNLLSSQARFKDQQILYTDVMHFNALASYRISVMEDKIGFTPFAMLWYNPSFTHVFDAGLTFDYKNTISISANYRSNNSVVASLGINWTDLIQAGYSYEQGFGHSLYQFSPNTHELFLGFTLGSKNKKMEAEKMALEESNIKLQMKSDSLSMVLSQQQMEMNKWRNEIQQKETEYQIKLADAQKQITISPKSSDKNTTPDQMVKGEFNLNSSDGVSSESLAKGHYIVVKSFLDKGNAEREMTEIAAHGYKPFLVFNKNRQYYYIYLEKFDNLSTALKELENVKTSGFKDAWLYLQQ